MSRTKCLLMGALAALALHGPTLGQSLSSDAFSNAPANAIRVMVTPTIRGPLDAVLTQAQQAIGKPIATRYGSARGNLKTEILAGQGFDVGLLVPDVNVELLAAGKVKPGSWEIARAPIGIGIRGDVPAGLDMKTHTGIRRAFMNAKSVRYGSTGAAIFTVRKILSTLRLNDRISDVSTLRGTVILHPGQYEIYIGPISEIIPNKDLVNTGPVIPSLQVPADIAATISANTRDEVGARALIEFLRGSAIDPALERSGMRKGRGGG